MIESPQVREWQDAARLEERKVSQARAVLRVLKKRFGEVPQTLVNELQAIEDLNRLDELLDEAIVITSIEAFTRFLHKDVGQDKR